jgi:hypothetical protein
VRSMTPRSGARRPHEISLDQILSRLPRRTS